jgi:hypothetical protein
MIADQDECRRSDKLLDQLQLSPPSSPLGIYIEPCDAFPQKPDKQLTKPFHLRLLYYS